MEITPKVQRNMYGVFIVFVGISAVIGILDYVENRQLRKLQKEDLLRKAKDNNE